MAVYTPITVEEAARWLAQFDAGGLVHLMPIVQGVENTNYLVHTTAGRFILTLFEKRVDPADLPFFFALTDHLHQKGIACPVTLRTREGQTVVPLKGKPAVLISFLEGKDTTHPTPAHCAAVGNLAATLHRATADFGRSRANALVLPGWEALAERCGPAMDRLIPGLWDAVSDALRHARAEWPSGLPSGVVHADLFPDNVFFTGDQVSGVIDFYFACTEAYAYDLAICLNAWCFDGRWQWQPGRAAAMLDAYQAVRPLSAAEAAALPVLLYGASLRFLLTRAHDALFHPEGSVVNPKDPAEYLAKLRFFRAHPEAVTALL